MIKNEKSLNQFKLKTKIRNFEKRKRGKNGETLFKS